MSEVAGYVNGRPTGKSRSRELGIEYAKANGGKRVKVSVKNHIEIEVWEMPSGKLWAFCRVVAQEDTKC